MSMSNYLHYAKEGAKITVATGVGGVAGIAATGVTYCTIGISYFAVSLIITDGQSAYITGVPAKVNAFVPRLLGTIIQPIAVGASICVGVTAGYETGKNTYSFLTDNFG